MAENKQVPNSEGTRINGENAVEYARRSAEVRRMKKCLRDIARAALYQKPPMTKEQLKPIAKYYGCKVSDITVADAALWRQVAESLKGDRGAFELLATYAGEKPAEVVDVNMPDPSIMETVKQFLERADDK